MWELGLFALGGLLFGTLALPLITTWSTTSSIALFLIMATVITGILYLYVGIPIVRAFGSYMLYLSFSSSIFVTLIYSVSTESILAHTPWFTLAGAFLLAWFIGFITPGAPAGLGVREVVLMFVFRDTLTAFDLLLILVLARIITITGDLLFFCASIALGKKLPVSQAPSTDIS
jgi:hypothetical protein